MINNDHDLNLNQEDEIGESITITNEKELMSITPEQVKKIKSVRIENQTFDSTRKITLSVVFSHNNIEQLFFDNCTFVGSGLWVLCDFYSATRIGFIRCGLDCNDLIELLSSSNPYEDIEVLDVSENNFENKFLFVDALKHSIFRVKRIKTLIISDNGFDQSIIPLLKDELLSFIREIIL